MLACVSTLSDIVSYKDVRHSKEWLTTNEALSYIEDNCEILSYMLSCCDTGKEYLRLYSWGRSTSKMRPNLTNILVKDNDCRKVVFWNVDTIKEQEALWKSYFDNDHWRATGPRWGWAWKAYTEDNQTPSETERGSFYDPEWFS